MLAKNRWKKIRNDQKQYAHTEHVVDKNDVLV